MDVKTAYLDADIDCEIYVEPPDGSNYPSNTVCKLNKCLYGLKQSGNAWNYLLDNYLVKNGFYKSKVDYCLYTKHAEGICLYLYLFGLMI